MRVHLPTLDTARRAMRAVVCAHCSERPAGSEQWESDVPRACEQQCPLFVNLGVLRKAALLSDPMLRSPRQALLARIEKLERPLAGRGALSRHKGEIVKMLSTMFGR
jgi:hypothetical protein